MYFVKIKLFDCFSPAVLLSGYKEKWGGGDKGNMGAGL